MNTLTELYTPGALERLRRKNKLRTLALAALGCAATLVCVCLCARIETQNARDTLYRVVAVSTAGGWLVLALWFNVLLPGRREAAHQAHMLSGERETDAGELTVTKTFLDIPRSAPLLRVELRDGERVRRLSVSPRKAALLPTGRRVKVWTVYGCIVAWEAEDERD